MADDTDREQYLAQRRFPDFYVSEIPSGGYQAIATYPIEGDLIDYGCKGVLRASSLGELELLCCAERIKRSMILGAVRLANSMAEREANRQAFREEDTTTGHPRHGDGPSGDDAA